MKWYDKNVQPEHGRSILGWARRPVFLAPAGPEFEKIRASHYVLLVYEGELHPECEKWAYIEGPEDG